MSKQKISPKWLLSATLLSSAFVTVDVIAQATQENPVVEEVIVEGLVRSSLRTALEVKRNANAVVDHISAEDINSVPALDLGEALQAIAGVQLNVEGSRRSSTINLRGLPSGYVATTANGHSFASPSQSTSSNGVGNPFGAFESSIFRGVTVYKSATADLTEGFISGIVDKKLPQSLERHKDELSGSFGGRYEELNDSYDPQFNLRGSKVIVDDVFAISGALAWSEQNFRRDSILVNFYEQLDQGQFFGINDWKQENGLSEEDIVLFPADTRQVSERAEGDRLSASFNAQWQLNEEWRVGLDYLGTRKDLRDGQLDQVSVSFRDRRTIRLRDENGDEITRERLGFNQITPNRSPFFGFTRTETDELTGETTATDFYAVSDIDFTNGTYRTDTRRWSLLEQTQGIFLTANWQRDNWEVESYLTISGAKTDQSSVQIDTRYRSDRPRFNNENDTIGPNGDFGQRSNILVFDPITGDPVIDEATGQQARATFDRGSAFSGRIFTGEADLGAYVARLDRGPELIDLSLQDPVNIEDPTVNGQGWRYDLTTDSRNDPLEFFIRATGRGSFIGTNRLPDPVNGTRQRASISSTAGERLTTRDVNSVGSDITYSFDNNDFISSIKAGFKLSEEEFDYEENRHSAAFVNHTAVNNDFFGQPFHQDSTDFFNGNAPGAFTADSGWRALNVNLIIDRLQNGPVNEVNEDGEIVQALNEDGTPVQYSIEQTYRNFYEQGLEQLNAQRPVAADPANPTPEELGALQLFERRLQEYETFAEPLFTSQGFIRQRQLAQLTNDFVSTVDISSLYGMANFDTELFGVQASGNFGLRYAHTSLKSRGLIGDARNLTNAARTEVFDFTSVEVGNSYAHFMPSFNMAAVLQPDLIFRTAAYRGIVRPNIAFFRPAAGVLDNDRRIRIQEPGTDVEPYVGDSIDFTLEWYNRDSSSLSIGVFAKRIANGFKDSRLCPEDGSEFGLGALREVGINVCEEVDEREIEVFEPGQNGAEGTFRTETINRTVDIRRVENTDDVGYVRGLELSAQQNLDFLDGFWGGFGGQANVSFVDTDDSGVIIGISDFSYNLIGYWENDWLSTRLSYNWRSDYDLSSTSQFTGNETRTVESRDRLDLSITGKIAKNTRLTFRAFNLTDYIFTEFQDGNSRLPRRINYDGKTFQLSISHRFF